MLFPPAALHRLIARAALAVACAAGVAAHAEGLREYPFRVEKVNGPRHLELIAHNKGPATMTVYLTIAGENIASDVAWPVTAAVPPFSSVTIGRVFPDDPKQGARMGYTVSRQYGDYRAVQAPETVYRLPYRDGEAYRITQAFGDPLTTHIGHHAQHAVDIAMPEGAAVVATRDGVVIDVTLDYDASGMFLDLKDKANVVVIGHDDGTVAHYAHLSKRTSPVAIGQRVTAGTVIGYSGNTGYSSGPHLHYAVTKPAVLADGRVANVALPVKFYVDTWMLPFEPRRGMSVTAAYSRESAMRAEKTPADAGQRMTPEPTQASVIPVRAFSDTGTGQAPGTHAQPVLTVTYVQHPAPNAAAQQPAASATPREPAPASLPAEAAPQPAAPVVTQAPPPSPPHVARTAVIEQHSDDPAAPGPVEAALIAVGAAFALVMPVVFWRRMRA